MQVQDKYIIRNLEMEKCKMVILQKFFLKIKDTMKTVEKEMESQPSSSWLRNLARVALNAK